MRRLRIWLVRYGAALTLAGTCYQLGGCGVADGLSSVLNSVNPCGTVLNCDPAEYQFVRSGIDGPGVDIEADPFCTYPPFCTEAQDPIFGGLSGATNP